MFVDRGIGDTVVQQAVVADVDNAPQCVAACVPISKASSVVVKSLGSPVNAVLCISTRWRGLMRPGAARLRAVLVEGDGQRERHPRRTHAAPGARLQR